MTALDLPKPVRPIDVDTLARTVWGEARGEGLQGMLAVAYVPLNRLQSPGWWTREKGNGIPDDTIQAACMDPWQFSMWNAGEPNGEQARQATLSEPLFRRAMWAALTAIEGIEPDPARGAQHYYAEHISRPDWVDEAMWAGRLAIGRHYFFPPLQEA